MAPRERWPTLTNLASADIDDILLESLLEWGPIQAERYYQRLADALRLIATLPETGVRDDRLPPGFRIRYVGTHAICYQLTASDVIVHRIVHQRRDMAGLFEDSE